MDWRGTHTVWLIKQDQMSIDLAPTTIGKINMIVMIDKHELD